MEPSDFILQEIKDLVKLAIVLSFQSFEECRHSASASLLPTSEVAGR